MKISTTNCEQTQNGDPFCCLFEKIKNNTKFLLSLILFFGLIQGVFAQGTLQPACNIGGPLEACAKTPSSNTTGDMTVDIDVARSGVGAILIYTIDPLLNSSGAFIRSFGPQVYHGPLDPVIALRNHTTQTLIVYPGGTGAGFNLRLNVENTESTPHTFCECSKSVSVSELTADSSHTPILCFGGLSTLTAEGHLSDTNGYTYTLLPSGPTNTTGIFPNLPGSVAGITYTVEVVSAENCVEQTSQTITQPADNPVILNCPQNFTAPLCSTQEEVNSLFNTWLTSFSFTGGTNPQMTRTPSQPGAPPRCGGTVEVRWDVTQLCYPTQTCSRTFTVIGDITVPVITATGTPTNGTLGCNPTATAINEALGTATATDNCGPVTPTFSDSTVSSNGCLRSQTRTWNVTDACGNAAAPVSRTATWIFDITVPVITATGTPTNGTLGCNPTATAINDALGTATATDNCGPVTPTFSDGAVSSDGCLRSQTRTWNVTDACGNAAAPVSRTATWTFATPVTLTCPLPVNLAGGSLTQAEVNALYNDWLGTVTFGGGCDPSISNNSQGAPSYCGGVSSVTYTVTSGCEEPKTCTATFTISQCASLGDFVWNDSNFNGVQDGGESGVPGVTVTLYNCSDNSIVAVQLTGPLGQYLFDHLTPGSYYVGFSDFPPNFVMTAQNVGANDAVDSDGNPLTGLTSCVTLVAGENNLTVDQGINLPQASLGDFVWNDGNFNGIQDVGELGVSGVTVTLYQCSDNSIVAVQLTGASGQYLFDHLTPGSYYVGFSGFPPNFVMTAQNAGANDAVDSDGNPLTGLTACVTLVAGENNLTVDQGINRPPLEGCTLGYWKNHTNRWCSTYHTYTLFGSVFVNAPAILANKTLLQALNLGGGGIYNLARQGVAALLNACSDEVNYPSPYSGAQSVINAVNAAYLAGGNNPGTLGSQLDVLNNTGCPLGGTSATTSANRDEIGFDVYPMPFKETFTIKYQFDYTSDVKIEVINLLGMIIYTKTDTNGYMGKEIDLNLNSNVVKDQIYFIKLTTNRGSTLKKVISSK